MGCPSSLRKIIFSFLAIAFSNNHTSIHQRPISLDRKVSSATGNDTTDLIEMIASSNEELDIYYQSELLQLLLETLNILTERERKTVILKHGLLDRNSKSLNAVSFEPSFVAHSPSKS